MQSYTVMLSQDPESGVPAAVCAAMPGTIAERASRAAALEAIANAMRARLKAAEHDGYHQDEETAALIAEQAADVLADRDAEGWVRSVETAMVTPAIPAAA